MSDPNIVLKQTEQLRYPGKKVLIGGREFVVPSMSVNQARTLWPEILALNKGLTVEAFPEKLEQVLRIIHAAVSRNYPDLTLEDMGDLVSADNTGELLSAVAEASGFITPKEKQDSPTRPAVDERVQ